MELVATTIALVAPVIVIMTELAKAVPVQFTTKYPAWVAGILSLISALITNFPAFTFTSIGETLVQTFFTAVLAGAAYNQYVKKVKEESKQA